MNLKVIPVHLEIDLKNPEQPLKVQYIVELTTEVYNDIMSSGMTYIADPTIAKAIEDLVDKVQRKISADLGLSQEQSTDTPNQQEEDL